MHLGMTKWWHRTETMVASFSIAQYVSKILMNSEILEHLHVIKPKWYCILSWTNLLCAFLLPISRRDWEICLSSGFRKDLSAIRLLPHPLTLKMPWEPKETLFEKGEVYKYTRITEKTRLTHKTTTLLESASHPTITNILWGLYEYFMWIHLPLFR